MAVLEPHPPTAQIIIGRAASTGSGAAYSSHSSGKLDLSGIDNFIANVNLLSLGHGVDWENRGYAELILAKSNQIKATTIETGRGTGHATIQLGQNNTIQADTFSLNIGKGWLSGTSGSVVKFQTGLTNPVLHLSGLTRDGVNLSISYNFSCNTSATTDDVMDLTGGTFNATINELILGKYTHTLEGGSKGTLIMEAGTVTANKIRLAETTGSSPTNTKGTLIIRGGSVAVTSGITDGVGGGTIQLDGGTMTVGGGLQVDNLRVGYDSRSATLTVTSGSVAIGTGTETFDIGYRATTTLTGDTVGTVDFSAASSVTINVSQLRLAHVIGSTASGFTAGTLILPTAATGTTSITAKVISLGDIPTSSGGGDAKLQIGAGTTTINVDQFYVGRRKKNAQVTIQPGGVVYLDGRSGDKANLYIGYNDVHTSGNMSSSMDLTGATLYADLDQLVVGYHQKMSSSSGSGTGVLTFEAGAISANTVKIGSGDPSSDGRGFGTIFMKGGTMSAGSILLATGANSATTGTFNISGGTLTAQSIVRGVGVATFNFTGGTLHVGTFGTSSSLFDLNQAGGILAPGNSIGSTTIYGNYNQASAGTLEIELAGLTSYDTVTVYGNADLDGTLLVKFLDGYAPGLGDTFNILSAFGTIDMTRLTLSGDTPPNSRWLLDVVPGQGTWEGWEILQLQAAVPEPTTLALAASGLVALLILRRWKTFSTHS